MPLAYIMPSFGCTPVH